MGLVQSANHENTVELVCFSPDFRSAENLVLHFFHGVDLIFRTGRCGDVRLPHGLHVSQRSLAVILLVYTCSLHFFFCTTVRAVKRHCSAAYIIKVVAPLSSPAWLFPSVFLLPGVISGWKQCCTEFLTITV